MHWIAQGIVLTRFAQTKSLADLCPLLIDEVYGELPAVSSLQPPGAYVCVFCLNADGFRSASSQPLLLEADPPLPNYTNTHL